MHELGFDEALELIRTKDPRFHPDAYMFVREALDHTQKVVARKNRRSPHVSGQELLAGIRDYALAQFGPMAMTVLAEWGVNACRDFGDIVFNMIEIGLLAKTEKDSRGDFEDGYDFVEAFRKPFLPKAKCSRAEPAPAPSSGD